MALLMNTPDKRVHRVEADIEDALIGIRRLKSLIAARGDGDSLPAAAAPLIAADQHITRALATVCENEQAIIAALMPNDLA